MNDLSLMIFAAGFGTRMGHLTEHRPKPLVPVAGRALIEYALDIARANDIASVVTNAHYKHEQLTAYFAKTTIRVLVEQPDILDTGGGCKAALPFLKGDTLVTLNSDAVWSHPVNLEPMFEIWDPRIMDALLLVLPQERSLGRDGRGDFSLSERGHLTRGGPFIYTGLQLISRACVEAIELDKFSLNLIWDRAMSNKRVYGISYPHFWCDVGTPEGIVQAEVLLSGNRDGS